MSETVDPRILEVLADAEASADGAAEFRLNEWECYRLCDAAGLARGRAVFLPAAATDPQRRRWATDALALADGEGRLLVKVCGRDLLHKTEIGGVRIVRLKPGDEGLATILQAATEVVNAAGGHGHTDAVEGVLACAFVAHRANTPGHEVLLTLKQDPAFGPVVVVGIGGTLTEWFGGGTGGRSTVIFPLRGLEPEAVAATIRSHPLLSILTSPSRLYAVAPLPDEQLVAAVRALAELGGALGPDRDGPTLEELEINPAVASEGRLIALDGVGLVSRRRWPAHDRPLAKIRSLLEPHSAVVMGVSARGANPGRVILENLCHSDGPVRDNLAVIHPRETDIAGVPCYPSCADLPGRVDLAVVAIPAEGALAAVAELVATDRAESIILIPGGFAETGDARLAEAIESRLAEGHAGQSGGPVMVGGNCLGIVSRDQYNTFFIPLHKLPFSPAQGGNLAIVSQSGAYLVTFASNYDGIIQPRASISFGNQMDLTVADFLEHFLDDEGVDVIACYVEGFRPGDGARFLEAVATARQRSKRVVVFKAGKTALGARAAASHTASLAGDYAVARACLAAAGADVAETLDDFEDLLKTFTLLAPRTTRGRRVGVLSNAGFECSTVMDALGDLELASFDAATLAAIAEVLPSIAHRDNPIDATPMADTDAYAATTEAILACPEVDVAILSAVPVTGALDTLAKSVDGRHGEDIDGPGALGRRWLDILGTSDKPAVVVIDSGALYDPLCRQIEAAGVPVFRKIDRAARALAAFCRDTDRDRNRAGASR